MMLRLFCENCEREATLEINGRYFCRAHALEKVRQTTGLIPPVMMVKR